MNELNKIRKIFAGRTHKLSGKVKLEIEKGQEKHRTIIAPYEPTVEKLQALITEQVRLGSFEQAEIDYIKNVIELDVERSRDYSESQLEWIDDLKAKVAQLKSTTLLEGEKK